MLKFSLKNEKDLGMVCHTPPLKKAEKQGEMPYTQPQSYPFPKIYIFKWDGTEAGYGISP